MHKVFAQTSAAKTDRRFSQLPVLLLIGLIKGNYTALSL